MKVLGYSNVLHAASNSGEGSVDKNGNVTMFPARVEGEGGAELETSESDDEGNRDSGSSSTTLELVKGSRSSYLVRVEARQGDGLDTGPLTLIARSVVKDQDGNEKKIETPFRYEDPFYISDKDLLKEYGLDMDDRTARIVGTVPINLSNNNTVSRQFTITNRYVTVKVELIVRATELFRYGDLNRLEASAGRNEGNAF